jgi:chromosome segregation ATPase
MRTLTIIVSGLVCIAISGCTAPQDDYDKLSAELVNSQQLVKEANEAHLKIAAENRDIETTLRETQEKLSPVQKELDEVKKQLLDSQNEYKKDVTALTDKNELLQTERDTAVGDAKKTKDKLEACQSELVAANKKNEDQQSMIKRQNLIIKELEKANAEAAQQNAAQKPVK